MIIVMDGYKRNIARARFRLERSQIGRRRTRKCVDTCPHPNRRHPVGFFNNAITEIGHGILRRRLGKSRVRSTRY
jgi:hypothetical protein